MDNMDAFRTESGSSVIEVCIDCLQPEEVACMHCQNELCEKRVCSRCIKFHHEGHAGCCTDIPQQGSSLPHLKEDGAAEGTSDTDAVIDCDKSDSDESFYSCSSSDTCAKPKTGAQILLEALAASRKSRPKSTPNVCSNSTASRQSSFPNAMKRVQEQGSSMNEQKNIEIASFANESESEPERYRPTASSARPGSRAALHSFMRGYRANFMNRQNGVTSSSPVQNGATKGPRRGVGRNPFSLYN